jgi:hypothetical protein
MLFEPRGGYEMICQDQGENLFKGHHANNLDEEAEL